MPACSYCGHFECKFDFRLRILESIDDSDRRVIERSFLVLYPLIGQAQKEKEQRLAVLNLHQVDFPAWCSSDDTIVIQRKSSHIRMKIRIENWIGWNQVWIIKAVEVEHLPE